MEEISEFLFDISQIYPISRGLNAEKVLEDTRTYLVGKIYNKTIDYKKAKTLMFDNKELKVFPKPSVIYDYLAQCEIKNYANCEDEGALVVITMPNGVMYDFTVTGFGKPLSQIKSEIVEKYGNVQVKTYPKGSVLIGKQVILP